MIQIRIFIIFLIVSIIIPIADGGEDNAYDKALAAKYGLVIAEANETIGPAPEWIRQADMFTGVVVPGTEPKEWGPHGYVFPGSGFLWKGYDLELEPEVVTRMVRYRAGYGLKKAYANVPKVIDGVLLGDSIKGVPLISHVPHSKAAFEQAHEQGFRAIPYVHFRCIHTNYADQDVFYFQHPEILLRDSKGHWVHTPMDGSDRLYRLLTCANSPSYWKLSLAYIKKMMDMGADGVFIDNVGERPKCFATKKTAVNPEFESYFHEHLFPESSHTYAWDRLLQAMRALVKSYGDDKIVLLNSGLGSQLAKNGDCNMAESFIYSWAWKGRRQTWTDIKKRAKSWESFIKSGRTVTALSYLNRSRKEIKDDAFWAFSAARLVDLIWWAILNDTGAEALYQAHMGKALESFKEEGGIAYRTFENGLIVLNDSEEDKEIQIAVADGFKCKKLLDLFDGKKTVKVSKGKITVTVPGKKARVYIWAKIYGEK